MSELLSALVLAGPARCIGMGKPWKRSGGSGEYGPPRWATLGEAHVDEVPRRRAALKGWNGCACRLLGELPAHDVAALSGIPIACGPVATTIGHAGHCHDAKIMVSIGAISRDRRVRASHVDPVVTGS